MSDNIPTPACAFLKTLLKRKRDEQYINWRLEFPEDWIEQFVKNGLIPFLKKYGYKLGFNNENCIQYLTSWAFLHAYNVNNGRMYEFKKWAHYGGNEEYEWYQYKIPEEDWLALMDAWKVDGFLDDLSDVGYKQRNELVWFIWHCIDLDNCPQHMRWLDLFEDKAENDDYNLHQDEANVYGGDRRTY